MSLLEDWSTQETARSTGDLEGLSLEPARSSGLGDGFGPESPSGPPEQPIFALELVERNVARGRGQVTAAVAANNTIAVVTSRGWLLRYDLEQGSTPVTELELSKTPDTEARGVWADPSGTHFVITASAPNSAWESFYMHVRWKKARLLGKLKGVRITAVAWPLDSVSENGTGEVAVGTEDGTVISLACEEREKKERGGRTVLDLSSLREPIRGLQQTTLPDEQLLLLVATPTRLYAFCCHGGLDALSTHYAAVAGLSNFVELPSGGRSGSLACFRAAGSTRPKRFAWLAGPGLYRGSLDLAPAKAPQSELDYLASHNLLPLPLTRGLEERPLAVAQTEYHELLLYESRLHAVNAVSQALVQDLAAGARQATGGLGSAPLGLSEDASSGAVFLFTADSLFEVVARDEERDMWKVYLERNDFVNAFRRCKTQAQRDAVNNAEATLAYSEGRHMAAARLWGKVTSPPPSFEEVALRFIDSATPDALQAFLLTKLDTLSPSDKAQATMVATWLTELLLDRINRALLEAGGSEGEPSGGEGPAEDLRAFLRDRVDVLDVRTTVNLLASYGRLDDMMQYASYRKDNEAVLDYLVLRGDAQRALAILRRPDVSQELVYKFAPSLMAQSPGEAVDAWMLANPPLQPSRLLPALLRYAEEGAPPACRAHALRFVQFCIHKRLSEDAAVHQLAVALHCSAGDEAALLDYLAAARGPLGEPLFDPHAALRCARDHGQRRACVELLWELRLFEDAVNLALESDMQQAMRLATRPQEDELLQRKLWLAIATHLIKNAAIGADGVPGEGIAKINDLVREAGGLIKIEDVLPLFPDFARIDSFRDAICASLEDYNAQIAGLRSEMDDATHIADALRKDVAMLESRRATLDLSEPCARCGRPVGEAPASATGPSGGAIPRYFLFPTGNAFHGGCLAQEVAALAPSRQAERITTLLASLAKASEGGRKAGGVAATPPAEVREMQAQLRAEITLEDPYNGEIVIRNIEKPFVAPDETAEIETWQL